MANNDYGSDLSTYANPASGVADLDPTWQVITGPLVVIQRVARKLMTPTGSMLKQGWGYDLRAVLQASLTAAQIGAIRGIIEDQVTQEPEVESAAVTITYTLQVKRLDIVVLITLITGETFPLVFKLTPDRVQAVVDDMVLLG